MSFLSKQMKAFSTVSEAAAAQYSNRQMFLGLRPTLLPWHRQSMAGFQVPTEIKTETSPEASVIPGTGWARFLKVPVRKGETIRSEQFTSVAAFEADGGVQPDKSVAIQVKSAADIESLTEFWDTSKEGSEVAEIERMTSWYLATVPPSRTDTYRSFSYILAHAFSYTCKHGRPGTVETVVEKGMLVHKAARDLDAGEELVLDYTTMCIEPFVQRWCANKGLVDVETALKPLAE